MDMRPFELANNACKPKHFAPPTALQRRLQAEAAYHETSCERRASAMARAAAALARRLRLILRH